MLNAVYYYRAQIAAFREHVFNSGEFENASFFSYLAIIFCSNIFPMVISWHICSFFVLFLFVLSLV